MTRVLVISPHPDDDAIGCGGTLRGHVLAGDPVRVIVLTSGEGGGHGRPPDETARLREREAEAAARILGIGAPRFWRQPDGGLRASAALVERLRAEIESWRPGLIYVTHEGEAHRDHRAAARLVRRALGAAGPAAGGARVRMFEVWTPLQRLDEIIDVTTHMDAKIEAIRAHASQCGVLRFDEAFRGLNRYRGELHSWPGGDYAEVFATMRIGGGDG